MLYDVTWILFL